MIPVDQTRFGCVEGNCTQACIASILEVEINEVPDAYVGDGSGFNEAGEMWMERLNELLAPRKIAMVGVRIPESKIALTPGVYCILGGMSSRGIRHFVVGRSTGTDIEVVHDPHPSREGLQTFEFVDFMVRT